MASAKSVTQIIHRQNDAARVNFGCEGKEKTLENKQVKKELRVDKPKSLMVIRPR